MQSCHRGRRGSVVARAAAMGQDCAEKEGGDVGGGTHLQILGKEQKGGDVIGTKRRQLAGPPARGILIGLWRQLS